MAMNTVHLASITKGGNLVHQFVVYDDVGRANYIAGVVMDSLCDYHGGDDWFYTVSPCPYVGSMTPVKTVIEHALSKAAV